MPIEIGDLTERGTIQQNTTTTDSHGGRSSSWGTLATVWMHVKSYTGMEIVRAQAVASGVQHLVTTPYRADVTAKMRILWTPTRSSSSAQRTLEVLAVRPAAELLFLELDCGELS